MLPQLRPHFLSNPRGHCHGCHPAWLCTGHHTASCIAKQCSSCIGNASEMAEPRVVRYKHAERSSRMLCRTAWTQEEQACQADAAVVNMLMFICDLQPTICAVCVIIDRAFSELDHAHPQSIQPHLDTVVSEWFCHFLFLPRLGL